MDIKWFDEDDEREFNVNNIDKYTPENNGWLRSLCSDDTKTLYEQIIMSYGMNRWVHLHPNYNTPFLSMYHICEKDLSALKTLASIRRSSGRNFKNSDKDNFSYELITFLETHNQHGSFVRMSHKSTKDGFDKLRPLYTVEDILDALTSSVKLLKTFVDHNQCLFVMPWTNIDPSREYRVFIIDNRVAAVSQQHCYTSFSYSDRVEIVRKDVDLILSYYENNRSKYIDIGYEEVTLDLYVTYDNEVRLIECNPPTLWCASGSSLFREHEILLWKDMNLVDVRIR